MKKILFPTDFSTHSIDVLHYALELAKKFDAKLMAMHVYGRPKFKPNGTPKPINRAEEMLDTLMDFVEQNKGERYKTVEVEHLVEVGFPAEAILEVVKDEDIGLIIMGMASKDDVAKNFFGSVARDVLKKVDCSTLVIPTNFKYKKINKITYATNFLFKDISALNTLKNWAKVFNSKISCLHTVDLSDELGVAIENMSILEEGFGDNIITEFKVMLGDLVNATNEYIATENIEMLAMLSRKRNLIQRITEGSNAHRMAKKIAVPLLVLKGAAFAPTKWESVVDKVETPLWQRD